MEWHCAPSSKYVTVISRVYGIYCTEARGREDPIHPMRITILYPEGIATMDTSSYPSNKQKKVKLGLTVNGKLLRHRRHLPLATAKNVAIHPVSPRFSLGMEEWADDCLESLEQSLSAGEDDCFGDNDTRHSCSSHYPKSHRFSPTLNPAAPVRALEASPTHKSCQLCISMHQN